MPTPFSLQGTFVFPPDDGQPVATRSFSTSGQFTSKVEGIYVLTGAGTHVVDLGTVAAAKALLIEVDPTALAPVNVTINGSLTPQEISPGGFMAYSNPVPVSGVTSVSLAHTMDARVQLYILG